MVGGHGRPIGEEAMSLVQYFRRRIGTFKIVKSRYYHKIIQYNTVTVGILYEYETE